MRTLKVLSFGLLAVAAFVVVAGIGTASATVLCKVKTAPCGANKVGKGEEIHSIWEEKTKFEGGAISIECAESTKQIKITNSGSPTSTVTAEITALTFNNCTNGTTVTVLAKGSIEYHWLGGTSRDGTETGSGTEITFAQGGLDCTYHTENTDMGELRGSSTTGATATSVTKVAMKKTGGMLCPETVTWTGAYKVDSPDTLDVMEA